jgi:cytochrome c5
VSTDNKRFADTFSIVMATLILIAAGLIVLSRYLAGNTQVVWTQNEVASSATVEERLKPVGSVSLPGEEQPVAETGAAASAPVAAPLSGPQVYNAACMACHGAGIGGAPKFGDKAAWGPRIAQGSSTLHDHAVNGFQGALGMMPAKGGRADLSDAEITAAVDYIVENSR